MKKRQRKKVESIKNSTQPKKTTRKPTKRTSRKKKVDDGIIDFTKTYEASLSKKIDKIFNDVKEESRYNTRKYKRSLKIGNAQIGVAAVLICAFVISQNSLQYKSVSKMTSSSSTNTNIRIAAFAYKANGEQNKSYELDSSHTLAEYIINLSNTNDSDTVSEVSIKNDVIIELPSSLPSSVKMTLKKADGSVMEPVVSEDGLVYTFLDAHRFVAGSKEDATVKLNFNVIGKIASDVTLNGVKVKVYTEQVD